MSTQDQQGTLVGATVEIQFATPIRYSAVSSPILTAMLRRNIPFGPSYPVSVSCKAHVRKRFGGKPGQAHSGEILIDSNRTSTVAIGTQMLSKDCCRRVGVFCSKSIVWQAWRLLSNRYLNPRVPAKYTNSLSSGTLSTSYTRELSDRGCLRHTR